MNQETDFSSLRNLLALKRLETPKDTQIEDFLTEFHRRQRAQLLVRESAWSRGMGWLKERIAGIQLIPSLSYGSAFAAIALFAVLGLSQQVQVTQVDGQSRLSFRMSSHDSSFAMVPGSLMSSPLLSSKPSDLPTFVPAHADSTATRYVLANNSPKAYDATVAF